MLNTLSNTAGGQLSATNKKAPTGGAFGDIVAIMQ
jgi:hypothetical protein